MSISFGLSANFILALLLAATGSSAAEESIIIAQSNAPAAPPESVEARIKLRQHREASALNRFTFSGNVLENIGDVVENWIVMFCPGWHEKCQSLLPSYELLGVQWEDKLNTALMSSKVRFAKVDCATEKALCVSLGIDDYPSVVHYREQQRVNAWFGGAPGLVRWVKEELQPPKKRKLPKTHPSASKMEQALEKAVDEAAQQPMEQNTCTAASSLTSPEGRGRLIWEALKVLPFLLMLLMGVCYCVSKYTSSRSSRQKSLTNDSDRAKTAHSGLKEKPPAAMQSMLL